jgi:hypothetical protein
LQAVGVGDHDQADQAAFAGFGLEDRGHLGGISELISTISPKRRDVPELLTPMQ